MLFWLLLALAQPDACALSRSLEMARQTTDALDLSRLVEMGAREAPGPCRDAVLAYLQGLRAAEAAYARGGSPESLEPVRAAAARLTRDAGMPPWAATAAAILEGAGAAAQSEREEMAIHLTHAQALESSALLRGRGAVPVVAAHEAAGDLWLRVHRFDEARAAYEAAAAQLGRTPRVQLGLARVAARTAVRTACAGYAEVAALAPAIREPGLPAWLAEARSFTARPECRGSGRR